MLQRDERRADDENSSHEGSKCAITQASPIVGWLVQLKAAGRKDPRTAAPLPSPLSAEGFSILLATKKYLEPLYERVPPKGAAEIQALLHDVFEAGTGDAQHETDALIDSLVYHQNTPAHTVTRLIQKLVTSNPSPRYVKRVADAFRTGTCAGHVYSGSYGDLGATVACALLDREARGVA